MYSYRRVMWFISVCPLVALSNFFDIFTSQTVSLLRQTADSYISVLLRAADNVPTDVQDDIRAMHHSTPL